MPRGYGSSYSRSNSCLCSVSQLCALHYVGAVYVSSMVLVLVYGQCIAEFIKTAPNLLTNKCTGYKAITKEAK